MNKILWSHKSDEYSTPQDLFDELNNEFNFTLDPCCTKETAKCSKFYIKDENGLAQSWKGEKVFCNPPYSDIKTWVKKAFSEWICHGTTTVLLIPARTDTKWFHEYILPFADIRFIRGRLKFGNNKNSAPFPSMICIFKPKEGIQSS